MTRRPPHGDSGASADDLRTVVVRRVLSDMHSVNWWVVRGDTHSVNRWVYNGVFFGVNNATDLSKAIARLEINAGLRPVFLALSQ